MSGDAIFGRWHDLFSAVGHVEQLGVRWEAAPGGELPLPSLVWRIADANEALLARCVVTIRAFRGHLAWELTEPRRRGEGRNWSLEPVIADRDDIAAARSDFLSLLVALERVTGVR